MIALDGQCIRLVGPQIARPRPGALPSDLLASALLTTCSNLQSDEILACFEEALGERQPEMGTDAAAGREANAESAEAAPRLEAAAEQQREHSLLAPTAGRGVEPVMPDPVPMLHTNSGGGRRSCEPDAGANPNGSNGSTGLGF